MSTSQKVVLSTVTAVLLALGAATMKAADHLEGATEFRAIGKSSVPLTSANVYCGFEAHGTLRGEPIGKASFTLIVGNPAATVCGISFNPFKLGALTLTKEDGSTLAMDVALATGDGGESFLGTFSAPNNLSGPAPGLGITSAVSSGDFENVVGAGHIVFGTGLNPNTHTYGTTQTIYLAGTLVFPEHEH